MEGVYGHYLYCVHAHAWWTNLNNVSLNNAFDFFKYLTFILTIYISGKWQ